jgi:hypothetical protein
MAFSVPLLDTTRAREVLDWKPTWNAMEALADLGAGLTHGDGMPSPVLEPRGLIDSIRRDVAVGPLTTRPIP